jgi:hypothetical protein
MIDSKWISQTIEEINNKKNEDESISILSLIKDKMTLQDNDLFLDKIEIYGKHEGSENDYLIGATCYINDRKTDKLVYVITFFIKENGRIEDITYNYI